MSDETQSGGSGCLKYLAFGCLGILGLGAITALALGALVRSAFSGGDDNEWFETARDSLRANIEWRAEGTESPEDSDLSGDPLAIEQSLDAGAVATEAQIADARVATTLPLDRQLGDATGSLTLELTRGVFRLEPFDGDAVEVINEYDTGNNANEFEFSHETTVEDDGSSHDVVRFRSKRNVHSGKQKLIVRVPRNRPYDLLGKVEQGESRLDIGGTTVRAVDLTMQMGDHALIVSEPTPVPVESISVTGRMGSLRFEELGNASPFEMELAQRMGELRVDLDGLWRNDSLLSMRCAMGECAAQVPEDEIRVEVTATAIMGGKTIRVPTPEESGLPEEAPLLRIRARVAMGEVSVR